MQWTLSPWLGPAAALALVIQPVACARAEAAPQRAISARAPVEVMTADVVERKFPKSLILTGSLAPNQSSRVATNRAGKVVKTYVERGTVVQQGDVLARLDADDAALVAAEARASAENARTQDRQAQLDCERAEQLFARNVISRAAYDQAKTGCDAASTSVEAAQARALLASRNVTDSVIRAPFAGQVVERFVSVGEYVAPGTPIARIIQVDPMRIELSVPETASGELSVRQRLDFSVAALPGERFEAKVRYIAPAIEGRSRNLTIEAVLDQPDPRLKPGMFVTTRLVIGQERALAVPASAVRGDAQSARAWVKLGHHLEERVIALGQRDGGVVAVKSGLARGERVVADPSPDQYDGQAVL
jgi:membrane fusion protein (multidrug efflux system)